MPSIRTLLPGGATGHSGWPRRHALAVSTLLALAVAPMAAHGQPANPTAADVFRGTWQGDDGSAFEFRGDRMVLRAADGGLTLVDVAPEPEAATADLWCPLTFPERTSQALVQHFADMRDAQLSMGLSAIEDVPDDLMKLDPAGTHAAMRLGCHEAESEYVVLDPDHLIRLGSADMGEYAPSVRFTRTGAAPPSPPAESAEPAGTDGGDAPPPTVETGTYDAGPYDAVHGAWTVACTGCTGQQQPTCRLVAEAPQTGWTLEITLNAAGGMSLAVPMLPAPDGSVWFSVEGQDPMPVGAPALEVVTPGDGRPPQLLVGGDAADRVVGLLGQGRSVTLNSPDLRNADYLHEFSLFGFATALEDARAHLPPAAPACQ